MLAKHEKSENCPACGGSQLRDSIVYNGYALKRCEQCQLVFAAQRIYSASQYEDVYSGVTVYRMMLNDARETREGTKGYRDLWWFKRMALRWIVSRVPSGRLLDVGSGPGTLLLVAQRKFGLSVQGIEPASAAAGSANEFGVPTFCGIIEQFAEHHPERFDAITSFEVLEHVPDPCSLLKAARRLLKDDGIIVLSVPNADDPYCLLQQITPAMPPIHINFFSRSSMASLLERSGFELKRSFSLPIPTSSVRNVHGKLGFILRLPYLLLLRLLGRADGTTLLVMASPRQR